MEKTGSLVGMAGTAAVVAAFVGVLTGGGTREAATKAARNEEKHAAMMAAAATGKPVSGQDLLKAFLGADSAPRLCSNDRPCYDRDVLLATVPDPFDSHLDWLYDSQMEALRRGFESNGYLLESFWMPWQDEELVGPGQAALRDSTPGVMLFRGKATKPGGSPRLRVLLLVGESPGAGLHARALERALAERSRLLTLPGPFAPGADSQKAPSAREVRIIGPAFSGSVGPMRRVLAYWLAHDTVGIKSSAQVVSGSATRDANTDDMDGTDRLTFGTTVHTVGASLAVMGEVLAGRMAIRRNQIAIFMESGTAYGGAADSTQGGMLHVTVPMNVGTLRAEADQADPRAAEVRAPRAGEVSMDLRDPGHPRESPAAMSELAAPVSDVVVDQLVRVLRHNDIRAVGLQFTDVRDQLFLAGKIRERLHDVQLFVFGSNSLFLRSDWRGSLLGMLTFSSYPPMWESPAERLVGGAPGDQMLFSDDGAEGTFNATVIQLGHPELTRDYANYTGLQSSVAGRPPLWVSAVGARGFVPVAALDPPLDKARSMVSGPNRAPGDEGVVPVGADALDGLFVLGLAIFGVALYSAMGARTRRFHLIREVLRARRMLVPRPAVTRPVADHRQPRAKRSLPRPAPPRQWIPSLRIEPKVRLRPAAAQAVGPIPASVDAAVPGVFHPTAPYPVPPGNDTGRVATEVVLPLPQPHGAAMLWRGAESAVARAWMGVLHSVGGRSRGFDVGPDLEQAVRIGSLLLHRELYHLLRLVALAAAALPPLAFYLLSHPAPFPVRMLVGIVAGAWLCAAAAALRHTFIILANYLREGRSWALRPGWTRTVEGRLWMMELVGRTGIAVAGVFYYGITVWYCLEVFALHREQPLQFQLLLSRAVQMESGLSPLLPLLLAAAVCMAWGTWQSERVRLLSRITAFEAACLSRAAGLRTLRRDGSWARRRGARRSVAEMVEQVRDDLFLVVPRAGALLLAILLVIVGASLLARCGRTLESAVLLGLPLTSAALVGSVRITLLLLVIAGVVMALPRHLRLAAAVLLLGSVGTALVRDPSLIGRRFFPGSSFDLLFGFSVVGTLVSTAWGVFRLIVVWDSLRRVLAEIEDTPLRAAFKRIPQRIARIMRLTVMGGSSAHNLDAGLRAQWRCLLDAYPAAATGLLPHAAPELREVMADPRPWIACASWSMGSRLGGRFEAVYCTLERLWAAEASHVRAGRVLTGGEDTDDEGGRYAANAMGRWKRRAEDLAALQVVDYVQWVLEALHKLAVFLFLSLLISTVLLSCYPFPGQSAVKAVFVAVLAVTVGSLLLVMVQMNRDEILSRISGTTAGKIDWDSSFVLNAMLVGVIPLVLVVSSEFPAVREVISALLSPLLKTFGG